MKTRGERFEEFLCKIGLIPWIGRQLGLIEIDSGDFLTAKELMAFPPATHGTPTQKVEEILASVEPLLKQIKHEAGIDDRLQTTFNYHNLYLDVIRNYATYIHLLPASENWHHSEHGGLLYHSLETSLEALKVFNNAHFRRYHTADIEVLRKPRWKYATWLAALLHDAGKPISDCRVICMKKGIIWPPHMMSIMEWSHLHKVERYKVAWKPERIHKGHESLAIHMLPKVLTEKAKRFLTDGPDDVYEEVGRVLANLEHSHSDIAKAVRTADSKSTARNIQKTWDRQLGEKNTSTVMLIVKGLRAKLSEWVVNEPKGHVWIINKEVYLAWPKAIQEVIEYLRKKEVVVPADTNTVYNMLYENHIIRNPDKDSKTTLFLPGDFSEDDAIKLRDNNVPVQWEFLVRVVWADYVFEGVPMPNTMNGILKLNKNFDMILVSEKGPTEIPAPAPQDNGQAQNNNQSATSPAQSKTNSNQPATSPVPSQNNNTPAKSRKSTQRATPANQAATQVKSIKQRNPKSKPSENDTSPFNPVPGTNFSGLIADLPITQVDEVETSADEQLTETKVTQPAQVEMRNPSEQIKQPAKAPSKSTKSKTNPSKGNQTPVDLEGLIATLASLCTPETTVTLDGKFYVLPDIIFDACQAKGEQNVNMPILAPILGDPKYHKKQMYNEIKPEYLDRFQMAENNND